MDPETKKVLDETLALTKENNRMLLLVRRSMRISTVMNVVYSVFIIGSAFGAYYLIQPYLHNIVSIYENASAVLQNLNTPR